MTPTVQSIAARAAEPLVVYNPTETMGRIGGAVGIAIIHLDAGWRWCVSWRNDTADIGEFGDRASAEAAGVAAVTADPERAARIVDEFRAFDLAQGGWRAAHLATAIAVGDLVSWTTSTRDNGSSSTFTGTVERLGPVDLPSCRHGIRLPGRKFLRWVPATSLKRVAVLDAIAGGGA